MRLLRRTAPLTALVALLLPAAAGAATPAQRFTASVSPARAGTPAAPAPVRLSVRLSFDGFSDAPPFSTRQVSLWFDRDLVFNGAAFPTCKASVVRASFGARCPKGSKVGTGTARGVAIGIVEDLTLTIFNGPANTIEIFVFAAGPLVVDEVIEAPLRRRTGAYGYRLDVPIPRGLQVPYEGITAALTDFRAKVGGTLRRRVRSNGRTVTRTVSYLGLARCSARSLTFAFTGSYSDGSSQSGTTKQTCR